jgi:hypothetical protein
MPAIPEIVQRPPSWRSARRAHAACLLGALLLFASEADASRVSLLSFEGDSAKALRWRVAAILKRAGHTVIGYAPPRNADSAATLRAYAKRRRADVFVTGTSVDGADGWELSLGIRDAEGAPLGGALTFTAASLGGLIKELKSDGQDRLDRALQGGAGSSDSAGGSDIDLDESADAEPSLSEMLPKKKKAAKKSRSSKSRRAVEEPVAPEEPVEEPAAPEEAAAEEVSIDGDEGADTESTTDEAPRRAKSSGWSASASQDLAEEDDSSLLSSDGGEVGADEGSTDEEASATSGGEPTVVLGVHAGLVRRTLGYVDDIYGRLRAPSANSWVYHVEAAVFPFARPVKDRIALIASYESAFSGVVRDNTQETDFTVTFSELFGGVRLRQPLGRHEIGIQTTIGTMQAGLEDPDGISGVPEFNYTLARISADARLHFGDLSLSGSAGYRLPLGGYGEVSEAEWFPRMEGYGLEGVLGLQYRLTQEVAFDISGSMRRFVLEMNSSPDDARQGTAEVAAGAIDLYVSGYFGLNITL